MPTTVVYYSRGGNNAVLARYLSQRLGCDLVPIVEVKRRSNLTILWDLLFRRYPRIEPIDRVFREYDRVVLVGPVWAGKLAAPLRTFLRVYRQQLHEYAFVTLCGYARPKQRDWLSAELSWRVGRVPQAVCELRVSELVPPAQRHSLRIINSYCVQEPELAHYREALEAFLRAAGLSGASALATGDTPRPGGGR
jgi:hypothetical protein